MYSTISTNHYSYLDWHCIFHLSCQLQLPVPSQPMDSWLLFWIFLPFLPIKSFYFILHFVVVHLKKLNKNSRNAKRLDKQTT